MVFQDLQGRPPQKIVVMMYGHKKLSGKHKLDVLRVRVGLFLYKYREESAVEKKADRSCIYYHVAKMATLAVRLCHLHRLCSPCLSTNRVPEKKEDLNKLKPDKSRYVSGLP